MENVFSKDVTTRIVNRINSLSPESQANWGTMNVSQMLAHCCVSYEYVFEEGKYPKPKGIKLALLKLFVKPIVVGTKPYSKNGRTAPDFIISDERDFSRERERLIGFIEKTQGLGEAYFEGKASHSFGKLKSNEWNNMFYKHLNHHLNQFGV